MSFIPKFINCPCCDTINIINVNGKSYENNFKILQDWTLKKLFNCRKCKSQLGLFIKNSKEYIQKLIWLANVRDYRSILLVAKQKNSLPESRERSFVACRLGVLLELAGGPGKPPGVHQEDRHGVAPTVRCRFCVAWPGPLSGDAATRSSD